MGLFSSSKSSKESNVNVKDIDETYGASEGSNVISRSKVNIKTTTNVLDEGAIENAFDFARQTYEQTGDSFDKVLGLVETAMEGSSGAVDDIAEAYQTANQVETPINSQTIMLVMAGVMGLVVVVALRKRK